MENQTTKTINSLPTVDQITLQRVKLVLNGAGPDAMILLKLVDSIIKVINGSGYGSVTTQISQGKVTMIKLQETNVFEESHNFDES